ncbi:VWA domain-containing protein [Diaphorobacter sp. HDW4B]|uniref:nitric oxide reductase activation protein NorD n=1 Tax=Diaphorobacter sp. HDW4B TaxID=2714925 RepID=UPI00140D8B42|nr:VWA domain-containing protein [Diaphorobacter sp. HDW4B]QIL72856.1 VWA domain-containing protein [Diaphorobacter sp. HDW4B]
MEEWVGRQWHRFITSVAEQRAPHAAVHLADMQRTIGLLFRAGGGDSGTRIAQAGRSRTGGPRSLLQRVAGSTSSAELGTWQQDTLALPQSISLFDDPSLNRALYLWLAALGSCIRPDMPWLSSNVLATSRALKRFAGLQPAYERLLAAQLAERPDPASLRGPQAQAELALQNAMRKKHVSVAAQSVTPQDVAPVWLWFVFPTSAEKSPAAQPAPQKEQTNSAKALQDACRRAAKRVEDERNGAPLVMFFRAESILSWAEFTKVNRADDDDDDGRQLDAANDMEELAIANDGSSIASRVKFDLDLPSAAHDDQPLGEGMPFPEWDWRKERLQPDHCAVQVMVSQGAEPHEPDARLRSISRRMKRHLDLARQAPDRIRGCTDGDEIDLDGWVRHQAETLCAPRRALRSACPPIYIQRRRSQHSLASLLLADLSQSTDAYATPDARVIELIRDSLQVFGEALSASGDAFEMLGFSSVRRQHVRIQYLKGFDERWSPVTQARVQAIKPGYYTRMGAAIRYATQRLSERPERQRLLLILTDGKPNDLDIYEGRYGLEDTRHAIQEARSAGLTPFCVTIDTSAHDYLPHLFGSHGYTLIHRPQELNHRLARLYAELTRN